MKSHQENLKYTLLNSKKSARMKQKSYLKRQVLEFSKTDEINQLIESRNSTNIKWDEWKEIHEEKSKQNCWKPTIKRKSSKTPLKECKVDKAFENQ